MDSTGQWEGDFWRWRQCLDGVSVCFLGKGPRLGRRAILRRVAPAEIEPAWLQQVHSAKVLEARPGGERRGDALVTRRRDLALAVVTADCVPVLIAGPSWIAAVHAGWRGLAQSILPTTLEQATATGEVLAAETLTAWIGPTIGPCCYEVGHDVAEKVCAESSEQVARAGPRGRPHLDLATAARLQLSRGGVSDIRTLDVCTRCDSERLYSYRRDGEGAGRNFAVIWRD